MKVADLDDRCFDGMEGAGSIKVTIGEADKALDDAGLSEVGCGIDAAIAMVLANSFSFEKDLLQHTDFVISELQKFRKNVMRVIVKNNKAA